MVTHVYTLNVDLSDGDDVSGNKWTPHWEQYPDPPRRQNMTARLLSAACMETNSSLDTYEDQAKRSLPIDQYRAVLHVVEAAEHGNAAVRSRAQEIIAALIELGTNVNLSNDKECDCRMAASRGLGKILRILINGRADVDALDFSGRTPLMLAMYQDCTPIIEILIAAGSNLAALDRAGLMLAHHAALAGRDDYLAIIIAAGACVHVADSLGRTPLHCSAGVGSRSVTLRLLATGCDVNARTRDRSTALHSAAANGHDDVVTTLLAAGADIECKDDAGDTPLHVACRALEIDSVKLLLAAGADVGAINHAGSSPLRTAADDAETSCLAWLLAFGADPNKANKQGDTPCHIAARLGNARAVELLLFTGCNRLAVNVANETPHQLALQNGFRHVAKLLAASPSGPRLTPSAARLAEELSVRLRRAVAREQLETIRKRASDICIGMQGLQLAALVILTVLDEACVQAQFVPMHLKWRIVTTIKHFHDRQS